MSEGCEEVACTRGASGTVPRPGSLGISPNSAKPTNCGNPKSVNNNATTYRNNLCRFTQQRWPTQGWEFRGLAHAGGLARTRRVSMEGTPPLTARTTRGENGILLLEGQHKHDRESHTAAGSSMKRLLVSQSSCMLHQLVDRTAGPISECHTSETCRSLSACYARQSVKRICTGEGRGQSSHRHADTPTSTCGALMPPLAQMMSCCEPPTPLPGCTTTSNNKRFYGSFSVKDATNNLRGQALRSRRPSIHAHATQTGCEVRRLLCRRPTPD